MSPLQLAADRVLAAVGRAHMAIDAPEGQLLTADVIALALAAKTKRAMNGQYEFDGRLDRICECGHRLGDHSGGSDKDCLRYSLPEASEADKLCRCQRFKERKLYLLQNLHAGYLGNSPMFWGEPSGYTQWIDEAKKFTAAECREIIRSTGGSHKWKRWSWLEIERAAQRTVDMQKLRVGLSEEAAARLPGG